MEVAREISFKWLCDIFVASLHTYCITKSLTSHEIASQKNELHEIASVKSYSVTQKTLLCFQKFHVDAEILDIWTLQIGFQAKDAGGGGVNRSRMHGKRYTQDWH